MKKITILTVIFMVFLVLVSCNKTENFVSEEPLSGTTSSVKDMSSANSSSNSISITPDKISKELDTLLKTVIKDIEPQSSKNSSGEKNTIVSESLPSYMSLEFVNGLNSDNYFTYKKNFSNFQERAVAVIEDLVSNLPDECVLQHQPEWIQNAYGEVERYIILDPSVIPEDYDDDLVLYLEYKYYEVRYGREYDAYYDVDMKGLEEKYKNIGTVLIDRGLTWLYLDPVANSLNEVELFPGYSEVKNAYYDIIDGIMAEEYKEISKE